MAKKIRLDQLLLDRNLVDSRSKAQALIVAGLVFSGEVKLDKPGHSLAENTLITVRGAEHPWVSRGGMKLAHALEYFGWSPEGNICLDVGASTGGFTDVLLTKGAQKVFAVDVGHGQLDWKLRNDARVVVLEKTNARYLDATLIPDAPEIIVCDASFISVKMVLPAALALAAPQAKLIALIKPQFEAGKKHLNKGVVRDAAIHEAVCADITEWLAGLTPWHVVGITPSPITGPKGNIEFLIAAEKQG